MKKKFFTVKEARQALPGLKDLIGKVVSVSNRMEGYRTELENIAELSSNNSGSPEATAYLEDLIVLQGYVNRVQQAGCVVKSLQDGLIDFPHLRDGREVYLCWKYGEDDIHFWHEVNAGFSGRTPLLE